MTLLLWLPRLLRLASLNYRPIKDLAPADPASASASASATAPAPDHPASASTSSYQAPAALFLCYASVLALFSLEPPFLPNLSRHLPWFIVLLPFLFLFILRLTFFQILLHIRQPLLRLSLPCVIMHFDNLELSPSPL